jgi:hypothetical protein
MPENFGVVCRNRKREQAFSDNNAEVVAVSVIISDLQSNPQCMTPCTTSACFASPRGLLSCCKTYSGSIDTVEVCGSSPHGPTILFLSFRWA